MPDAGFTEKRNLAFASDDLPDIILRAKISPQEEMKYAANGQLVALDEYLDYAPNLSALIEQDDAIRKGITMPDGHIYSCPQLNKTEGNLIHHYWINKTWLDNLGLEAPTTVDELYDVLVAFRDNDPNGNGQKDEIPYCVVGKDYPHRMFYDLLGSWGFGINGVMDSDYAFSWLDIDDAGKVRFIGREDKFKNMVEFYNKLWTEGLSVQSPPQRYRILWLESGRPSPQGYPLAGRSRRPAVLWVHSSQDICGRSAERHEQQQNSARRICAAPGGRGRPALL